MEANNHSISSGKEWEAEFFGLNGYLVKSSDETQYSAYPASLREVIFSGISGSSVCGSYEYNPKKPKPGLSRLLWQEVRRHLPPIQKGLQFYPLHLYLAVGGSALDRYHGIDAFFLWRQAHVTIDVSLRDKVHHGGGANRLKADFVVRKCDLVPSEISSLGLRISNFLLVRDHVGDRALRAAVGFPKLKMSR